MMAARLAAVLSLLAGGALLSGCGRGADSQPVAQTPIPSQVAQSVCPVMGEPIDQGIFLDYEGRRVYFCCPNCVDPFLGAPARYLAKLDGPAPAAQVAQANCAVMADMPISKSVYTDYEGRRVYFCCEDCIPTFLNDPQAYLAKLDGQADPAPAPAARVAQADCPVMDGMPINKSVYTDYEGRRVYFCCEECIPKFNGDPQTYLKRLDLQAAL